MKTYIITLHYRVIGRIPSGNGMRYILTGENGKWQSDPAPVTLLRLRNYLTIALKEQH